MTRLFENFLGGTVTDAPLTDSATTFNSAELALMPVVVAPDFMKIVFDGDGGNPEIAYVTAHGSGATVATITRGQEGTAAQEWPATTTWDNTVTAVDYEDTREADLSTIAATGAGEDLAFSPLAAGIVHDVTMDQNCTFTFSGAESGVPCSMTVVLRGAFTPTWPSSVEWPDGAAPTYGSPAVYEFLTLDGGTTVFGFLAGASFA